MRTEKDIRDGLSALWGEIVEELRTPTNSPSGQWASLKVLQAKRDALAWVLEDQEAL